MTPSTLPKRITKGTAEIDKDTYIIIDKNTDVEFDVIGITANKCSIVLLPLDQVTQEEAEANAELITEAFNTTHKTGFTPKELAKQKAELFLLVEFFRLGCRKILEGGFIDAKYWEKKCDEAIQSTTN